MLSTSMRMYRPSVVTTVVMRVIVGVLVVPVIVSLVVMMQAVVAERSAKSLLTKRLNPTASTIIPQTRLSTGNRRSGRTYCEANIVNRPSAKTPAV